MHHIALDMIQPSMEIASLSKRTENGKYSREKNQGEIQDNAIVTNKKAENLTKNVLGAKNIGKLAINVERAPDSTERAISVIIIVTRSARVSP